MDSPYYFSFGILIICKFLLFLLLSTAQSCEGMAIKMTSIHPSIQKATDYAKILLMGFLAASGGEAFLPRKPQGKESCRCQQLCMQ